jgi:transposase
MRWLKPLISRGKTPLLEADKGYDAKELRVAVLMMKIFPMIPYKRGGVRQKSGTRYLEKKRWVVERAISWLQRKFRRVAVRWERELKYWEGFLNLALIYFWMQRLLGL